MSQQRSAASGGFPLEERAVLPASFLPEKQGFCRISVGFLQDFCGISAPGECGSVASTRPVTRAGRLALVTGVTGVLESLAWWASSGVGTGGGNPSLVGGFGGGMFTGRKKINKRKETRAPAADGGCWRIP